ncbi:unnamed protein product [Diamesa tonsa]
MIKNSDAMNVNNAAIFKRKMMENSENILLQDPLAKYLKRRTEVNSENEKKPGKRELKKNIHVRLGNLKKITKEPRRLRDLSIERKLQQDTSTDNVKRKQVTDRTPLRRTHQKFRKNNEPIKKPEPSRRMMVQNTYVRRGSNDDKNKRKLRKKNEKNIADNVKRRMVETSGKSLRRSHNTEDKVRRQKPTKSMENTEVKRRSNKIIDPIAENELIREKNRRISKKNRRLSKQKESKRRNMKISEINQRRSPPADDVKLQSKKTNETLLQDSTTLPKNKPVLVIRRNPKKSIPTMENTTVTPTVSTSKPIAKNKTEPQPTNIFKRSVLSG